MTFKDAYLGARAALRRHTCTGSDSAREAELFVAWAARVSRELLTVHPENIFSAAARRRLDDAVRRRLRHEPVEYITGNVVSYGLTLRVTRDTLIPRIATEMIIEAALAAGREFHPDFVADIGTGSGCIALALAAESTMQPIVAVDLSAPALRVARANAKSLGLSKKVVFKRGSLLEPIQKMLTRSQRPMIVANLPYVPRGEMRALDREIRNHEPASALDGGGDGLDFYRALIAALPAEQKPILIFEILPKQFRPLATLLKKKLGPGRDPGFPGMTTEKIMNGAGICIGIITH